MESRPNDKKLSGNTSQYAPDISHFIRNASANNVEALFVEVMGLIHGVSLNWVYHGL
jgi:hypothetical protein